jgi:hypothetical protein
VCGEAEVDGDFIVPCSAAHLEGALNLDLEGAFHSPLGSKVSFLGPWYGSDEFLGQWVEHVGLDGSYSSEQEEPTAAAAAAGAVAAGK